MVVMMPMVLMRVGVITIMMMRVMGIVNVIVVMMVVVIAEAGVTIIATTCGCDRGMRVVAMMVVGAVSWKWLFCVLWPWQ